MQRIDFPWYSKNIFPNITIRISFTKLHTHYSVSMKQWIKNNCYSFRKPRGQSWDKVKLGRVYSAFPVIFIEHYWQGFFHWRFRPHSCTSISLLDYIGLLFIPLSGKLMTESVKNAKKWSSSKFFPKILEELHADVFSQIGILQPVEGHLLSENSRLQSSNLTLVGMLLPI